MARKASRGIRNTSTANWNYEPDSPQADVLEPGDLVKPSVPLWTTQIDDDTKLLIAQSGPGRATDPDEPGINGRDCICMYVGERHVLSKAKIKTGSHWTQTKDFEKILVLYNIFLFNGIEVAIDIKHVTKIQ